MENNQIKLYPSNWLYNAGVIGFLKVLESGNIDIEKWLGHDGTVTVDRKVFDKSLEVYKQYNISKGEKEIPLIGKNKRYPNYLQKGEEPFFEEYVKNLEHLEDGGLSCGICYGNFSINLSNLNEKTRKIAIRVASYFQIIHSSILAPSIGEFPNAFWSLNNSIPICSLCAYLIIHHHIPFENAVTQEGEIFINAPSFKIMWYINKFAEKVLTKSKEHELRKILALSLIEFAQKVSVTLGAWSIMNIEMIIKKSRSIDYYCLPYEISKVLLQRDIATLISETKEPKVLETVLNGKFDYLLTLNHKILRSLTSGSDTTKDNSLSELINKDASNLRSLSRILPELYAKIDYTIKKG